MKGPARAFGELAGRPYNPEPFGEVPCVCLRIPTGGGKTVLAAHAVPLLARAWRAATRRWWCGWCPATPSAQQTLKALQTPGHPYRRR
jgi:type III restriction enzyme